MKSLILCQLPIQLNQKFYGDTGIDINFPLVFNGSHFFRMHNKVLHGRSRFGIFISAGEQFAGLGLDPRTILHPLLGDGC